MRRAEQKIGQVGNAGEGERQLQPVTTRRAHPLADRQREVTDDEPKCDKHQDRQHGVRHHEPGNGEEPALARLEEQANRPYPPGRRDSCTKAAARVRGERKVPREAISAILRNASSPSQPDKQQNAPL
jgi:hypothetical protein